MYEELNEARRSNASITCHLACHNFIAGFCVEYGNSGAGMHRGAFSLRRKRTSPRQSPRASKCRAGLASDPGRVTWGKGCRQYVSGQQSDSLQTRPWQRGLALFRPWWSVPYHLKSHDFIRVKHVALRSRRPIRVLQFACWSRIGTTALTVVRPTTESISSRPPICSKRSRMLANPTPHVKASFWPTN